MSLNTHMSLTKQCKVHQPSRNFKAGAEIKTPWFITFHLYPVINHISLCFHPFTFRSCFPSSHLSVILSLLHLGLLLLLHFNLIASFTVFLLSSISSQLLCLLVFSQSSSLFSPTCSSPQGSITPSFHTSCSIFPPRMHLCFNALSFAFMLDLFSLRHTFLISFSTPPTCLPFHFL